MDIETRIKEVIEGLRPYLVMDGGDLEFVEYKDNIVYVKFLGGCSDCPMKQDTLNYGIKDVIMNEIDEVIDVKLV